MKQKITVEQLNELSDKGKKKLFKWALKKKYYYYHGPSQSVTPDGAVINKDYEKYCVMDNLSIGQMIEFLVENKWINSDVEIFTVGELNPTFSWQDNLCDSLWIVMKEILEK